MIEARRGGEQFGVERLDALLGGAARAAPSGDRRRPRWRPAATGPRASSRTTSPSSSSSVRRSRKTRRHEPQPGSSRGAGLRRRHRLARDRDRRLAHARALFRVVHDRLGEPDRDRPRGTRARLLARRQARRSAARAPAPRADRARRRPLGGDDAVSCPPVPRRRRRQSRRRLGRCRDRVVLRRAAPVRARCRPTRDGRAIRDPACDHRRRERRRSRRQVLRAVHCRLAVRDLRAGADRDPADGNATDAARDGGAAGGLGLVPAREKGDRAGRGDRRAGRAPARRRQGGGGAAARGGLALSVHPGGRAR